MNLSPDAGLKPRCDFAKHREGGRRWAAEHLAQTLLKLRAVSATEADASAPGGRGGGAV